MFESSFIEQLIDLMSRDQLESTAKIINLKIPGFSVKRINSIPDVILQNHLKRKLQKVNEARLFFKAIVQTSKEEYQGLSQEEFIYKLDNDHLDIPLKLILLTYYFPELYTENKDEIFTTLMNDDQLSSVLLSEKDVKKELKVLAPLEVNFLIKKIKTIFRNVSYDQTNKNDIKSLVKLMTTILKEEHQIQLNDIDKNELEDENYLHIFLLFFSKLLLEWDNELEQNNNTINQQKIEIAKLEEDNKKLHEQLSELNKEMDKIKTKYKVLQQEIKNKTTSINALKQSIKEKESTEKSLKLSINNLHHDIENMKAEIQEKENFYQQIQLVNENIKVFSSKKDRKLEVLIGSEKIIYFEKIEDFYKKVNDLNEEIVFIVTDGIPTRNIFKLENQLKTKKHIKYRLVSQGTQNIIRSIITYLEGELRYEVVK
jgi:SMC interacting uncharacterized protein involved in chromosome segregation